HSWCASFNGDDVSRANEQIRRPTFRRPRIFIFGNESIGSPRRLDKFWSQNFCFRPPGDLVGSAVKILKTVGEVQNEVQKTRRVLVPTMGALHKAHGELIRVAHEKAGKDGEVVVSILVNPFQFEPGSDYERYPRPEKEDEEFCRKLDVDLLFRPTAAEMYADDRSVFVDEN